MFPQSPEHSTPRSPLDLELQPCDAKALLDNEVQPMKTVLEGVDVQRGYGLVRTEDGRRAELATVAVEAWHIKEHGEEELPEESVGQLHEGDAYIICWKYSITTLGESFENKYIYQIMKQSQGRAGHLIHFVSLWEFARSCQLGRGRNPEN